MLTAINWTVDIGAGTSTSTGTQQFSIFSAMPKFVLHTNTRNVKCMHHVIRGNFNVIVGIDRPHEWVANVRINIQYTVHTQNK